MRWLDDNVRRDKQGNIEKLPFCAVEEFAFEVKKTRNVGPLPLAGDGC